MLHNRNMLVNGFREVIVTYFKMVQSSINILILLFEPCNTQSSFQRIFNSYVISTAISSPCKTPIYTRSLNVSIEN